MTLTSMLQSQGLNDFDFNMSTPSNLIQIMNKIQHDDYTW